MENNIVDTTKRFAVMVLDNVDVFGVVCSRNGAITAAGSAQEMAEQRKETLASYASRGGTWAASAAMNNLSFNLKAVEVENASHFAEMVGDGPYTIKSVGNVAGHMYVMSIPRERLESILDDAIDI